MVGTTYVSDPRVWKSFYKNMIDGKFNPSYYRGRQSGGGIANMYSKKPYMIPVNPHVTKEPEQKLVVGKEVTSTAAVEDRARSEFNEAIQDGSPHVPIGIKRPTPNETVIYQPASKKRSSLNAPKTANIVQSEISKRGKPSDEKRKRGNPGNRQKTQKRKYSEFIETEDEENIFGKRWRI